MSVATKLSFLDSLEYKQINFRYDSEQNIAWIALNPKGRPCFNQDLLNELDTAQQFLKNETINPSHLILTSDIKGVFSFGGDLNLFTKYIRTKDRQGLSKYMKLCIDVLMSTSYLYNLEKVAVVQGSAFGGGFEAALSCSTIIAEKSAEFGFPERLFNLFPGMGAYSYLIRRVSPNVARRIVSCERKKYSAQELYDLGIVDILVDDGTGKEAAAEYVKHRQQYSNGYNAIRAVTDYYHKVHHTELHDVGEQWVKAALHLKDRDLRFMEMVAKGQHKFAH